MGNKICKMENTAILKFEFIQYNRDKINSVYDIINFVKNKCPKGYSFSLSENEEIFISQKNTFLLAFLDDGIKLSIGDYLVYSELGGFAKIGKNEFERDFKIENKTYSESWAETIHNTRESLKRIEIAIYKDDLICDANTVGVPGVLHMAAGALERISQRKN